MAMAAARGGRGRRRPSQARSAVLWRDPIVPWGAVGGSGGGVCSGERKRRKYRLEDEEKA